MQYRYRINVGSGFFKGDSDPDPGFLRIQIQVFMARNSNFADEIFSSSSKRRSIQPPPPPLPPFPKENIQPVFGIRIRGIRTSLGLLWVRTKELDNEDDDHCCGFWSGIRSLYDPAGSRIGLFRIPDLGSQTHIFDILMTNFWVKNYYNS